MTTSRPFDASPVAGAVPAPARAVSWDSQLSGAVPDIARLHTEYLEPPAYLRSLMPTELLTHPSSSPHVTHGPRAFLAR